MIRLIRRFPSRWCPLRAIVILFVLHVFGLVAAAQAQTRAEEWIRLRVEKADVVTPPERGGLENGLFQFEEKRIMQTFERGFRGFHPKLGGLATGSGFALGTEFRSERLRARDITFRIAGQASLAGYQLYEFQFGHPRLANNRILLDFMARHRNYPQEDFFGVGSDSVTEDRTNFRLEDTLIQGTAGLRPLEWLSFGAQGGFLKTNTGSGTDMRFPTIETRFDDSTAPGLDDQPDYVHGGAFVDIDYRDSTLNARSGGHYRFEWTSFQDRNSRFYGFDRVDAEVQQYFPFFNLRRVIAFRARTSLAATSGGHQVPFFMMPTLGGPEDLRGFREFRFRDQNLMLMNLEYRWEAFSGLDMAVFGDAGKVFSRRADLDFSDLETTWGVGARFNSANGVFFRIDTGFSNEGTRIFYKFGHSF